MVNGRRPRDIEKVLAERKRKTTLYDLAPVTDAVMLHYVMDALYTNFLKQHRLRADWHPLLIMSAKKYVSKVPRFQVQLISSRAARQANLIFGTALGNMGGIDIRHAVIAFAQVVLTLVDQHRYRYTDDSLVLQSIGIINEAIEERVGDWEYHRGPVRSIYHSFMKKVDGSPYFKIETDYEGIVGDVLLH